MVLIWHNNHMARVILDPKGIDKGGSGFILVDNILLEYECFVVFYSLHTKTNGANVILRCVGVHPYISLRISSNLLLTKTLLFWYVPPAEIIFCAESLFRYLEAVTLLIFNLLLRIGDVR